MSSNNKKYIVYIFLASILFILIYFLFVNDVEEKRIEDNININKEERKVSKKEILYTVNNDFTGLKNPFSFNHEINEQQEMISSTTKKIVDEKININNDKQQEKIKVIENDKNNCKLKAVLKINDKKLALLKIKDKTYRVYEGDLVENLVVISIKNEEIILQSANKEMIKVKLRK